MFDADRPIQTSAQDRLGRTVFAKYLARCILDHTNPDSLVIGLYGGWGAGKTSVINLMLEELRYASHNMFDDEKPIILNFSAWSYSGQNQLIESFFRRLSSEMRRSEYFEQSKKIVHLLELYISFFTHKPVPQILQPKQSWLSRIMSRGPKETYGWESGRDLTLVKAELNELLLAQKHKLIIIIDNISRLADHEINQVFQMVKSMGDYANTVYVLAMDKEQVMRAMNHIHGADGHYFLDKIVQLPFDIPIISKQDLDTLLLDRLKKLIQWVPEGTWNKDEWANLYYVSLQYFFKSSRDITRYINTLSFSYAYVKEIVNPVDFFAITVLDVFEPDVYNGIRENKDLFTDFSEKVYKIDAERSAEDRRRCDEIINRTKQTPCELILQLLLRLFPHLRKLYEPDTIFYYSDAIARKNKRICIFEVFDVYFRMMIPSGYISDAEMNAILSFSSDQKGFGLALLRLNQDGRILRFLDILDGDGIHKIVHGHIKAVLNALMDSADLFPDGETSPVNFNTPMRVHRIVHQLLRQLDTSDERFSVFQSAIEESVNSIYSIVHELREQKKEHIENDDTFVPMEHRDFTSIQLDKLQKTAVIKLKQWAESGRLIEHPKLLPLLYAYKEWGGDEECRRYVRRATENQTGLLSFLMAILQVPIERAMTKLAKEPHGQAYLQTIDDFVPAESLKEQAVSMFESATFEKLSEREQLGLLIFLDLMKAHTNKVMPGV